MKNIFPQKKTGRTISSGSSFLGRTAAFSGAPHSCMCKMEFSKSDFFGHRGELFVTEWGSLAPLNSPHPEDLNDGFRVIRVDVLKGTAESFMHNREKRLASALGQGK